MEEPIDVSEENVPPPKKLKQAKLSFFKALPSEPKAKVTPALSGKKRKTSGSSDSPNKIAKTAKAILVACHAESPNSPTKQSKPSKVLSTLKLEDTDDHEVSSSSEADSAGGKSTGKCCLMERFVVKLPPGVHQEISSTVAETEKCEKDHGIKDITEGEKSENDILCESSGGMDKNTAVREKCDEETSDKEDLCQKGDMDTKEKDEDSSKSLDDTEVMDASSISVESTGNLDESEDEESKDEENTNEKTDEKILNESVTESQPEHSAKNKEVVGKTPGKRKLSQSGSPKDGSAKKTPKTPKSSAKKGLKVDSAKKAEKEALKQKQKEEKERERLEKKRKLEEEKAEKEKQRLEKKEAKEKEKQEQKEKLEKEKQEKLKAKEEERKKKEEEKRIKEEERKKAQELKDEEKRKKEEERKKKEEEKRLKEEEKQKEEEEKRKKEEKTKQAFQSFFIKPKETEGAKPSAPKASPGGLFIPFEVKKDMHLAPSVRESLSQDKKDVLDAYVKGEQKSDQTYIGQLKSGDYKPFRTGKILRKNPQPAEDIEIIHDEEALKKVFHEVKLLQFHTDYRPPYYGTWRKAPKLNPRNPWKKDESVFDYEVDSDEEWEEEEPGESLSCSEGEEEKAEEGEEEEDDGWMVPHGYLSEDEGCNDDDEITPEKLKIQQQAKAKAWEEEYKRKLQAVPVVAVGCFFESQPSHSMMGDVRLLYEFKAELLCPVIPIRTALCGDVQEEELDEEATPSTPGIKGPQKMSVPEEAMPDLIKLLHGNPHGIKRLIREFRTFWLQKNPPAPTSNEGETAKLDESIAESDALNDSIADSSVREEEEMEMGKGDEAPVKRKEEGSGCSISKRQLEIKITAIAARMRKPGHAKMCWYVHDTVLSQYAMTDLALPNSWVYVTSVPTRKSGTPTPAKLAGKSDGKTDGKEEEVDKTPVKPVTPRDQKSIKEFALSKEECEKQNKLLPQTPLVTVTLSPQQSNGTPQGKEEKITPLRKGKKLTPSQKGKKITPQKPKTCVMDLFKKKVNSSTKKPNASSNITSTDHRNVKNTDSTQNSVVVVPLSADSQNSSDVEMIDEATFKNEIASKISEKNESQINNVQTSAVKSNASGGQKYTMDTPLTKELVVKIKQLPHTYTTQGHTEQQMDTNTAAQTKENQSVQSADGLAVVDKMMDKDFESTQQAASSSETQQAAAPSDTIVIE